MYFLVLLRDVPLQPSVDVDHEAFIASLVQCNLVLLGGPFAEPPEPAVRAGYVLRCDGAEQAEAIVAGDPLVESGACTATITAWELVGVNRAAIDPQLQLEP